MINRLRDLSGIIEFREMVAGVVAAIASAAAIVASPDWPVALLIVALIVSMTGWGLMIRNRIERLDQKLKECEHGRAHEQLLITNLRQDLHRQRLAIACVYIDASRPTGVKKERRAARKLAPLEMWLGDNAQSVLDEAAAILRAGHNTEKKN